MQAKALRFISILLILSLMLSVAGCGGKTDDKPIKIGLVVEQTGDKAVSGPYTISAVEMAIKEWNEKGGVMGRKIELIIEDDASTSTGAISAFQKIISTHPDVAGIVIPVFSVYVMAMEPFVKDAGIPVVTGATNAMITQLENPWIFRIRTSADVTCEIAAKYTVENLGKKVGIIFDSDEYGRDGASIVRDNVPKFGGEVVSFQVFNSGDKDFSAQLLNIKKDGAEAIVAWGHALEAGLILSQKKELGIDIPIYGAPVFVDPITLDIAKDAADGVYAGTDFIPEHFDPAAREWNAKFEKDYGLSGGLYSTPYYDGTNILLTAIKNANSTKPDDVRKAILNVQNYKGMTGTYSFAPNGNGIFEVLAVQVVDGTPVAKGMATLD